MIVFIPWFMRWTGREWYGVFVFLGLCNGLVWTLTNLQPTSVTNAKPSDQYGLLVYEFLVSYMRLQVWTGVGLLVSYMTCCNLQAPKLINS